MHFDFIQFLKCVNHLFSCVRHVMCILLNSYFFFVLFCSWLSMWMILFSFCFNFKTIGHNPKIKLFIFLYFIFSLAVLFDYSCAESCCINGDNAPATFLPPSYSYSYWKSIDKPIRNQSNEIQNKLRNKKLISIFLLDKHKMV